MTAAEQRKRERAIARAKLYKTAEGVKQMKRFGAASKKQTLGKWAFAASRGRMNGQPLS